LLQRLSEHVDAGFLVGVRDRVHEHANTPHALWLRPRTQRPPDRRATKQAEDIPAFHGAVLPAFEER
jgi:hypothetical protein